MVVVVVGGGGDSAVGYPIIIADRDVDADADGEVCVVLGR